MRDLKRKKIDEDIFGAGRVQFVLPETACTVGVLEVVEVPRGLGIRKEQKLFLVAV